MRNSKEVLESVGKLQKVIESASKSEKVLESVRKFAKVLERIRKCEKVLESVRSVSGTATSDVRPIREAAKTSWQHGRRSVGTERPFEPHGACMRDATRLQ